MSLWSSPPDAAVSPGLASTSSKTPPSAPPSSAPSASMVALALLREIHQVAERADADELAYIAWRTTKLANNLCYLAGSAAGMEPPLPADP